MNRPRRTMGELWWVSQLAYLRIMLRELSAFLIAAYLVIFLILLHKLGRGEAAYISFRAFLWSPGMIVFHFVALAFALIHTITWFNLTPKAMVIWRGEERVHPALIAGPNYFVWAGVTAFILWFVLT